MDIPTFFTERVCHTTTTILNLHGVFPFVFISISSFLMGYTRYQEIVKARNQPDNEGSTRPPNEPPPGIPDLGNTERMVTVIMPCKGVHDRSVANWHSHLEQKFNGKLEFVFCVESETDEAYETALQFKKEMGGTFTIHVANAGLSFHNSQKIHNCLEGIAYSSPKSRFVLLIDDDVQFHPHTIEDMCQVLEDDPEAFVSTGYTVDLPKENSWFSAYMVTCFRWINLLGFTGKYPAFCWGGCLMFRKSDIDANKWGLLDCWRDGGYSEDMLTSSLVRMHNRKIGCNRKCIFPNVMDGGNNFQSFYNYICRQFYVLDTYGNPYNKLQNRSLVYQNLFANMFFVFSVYALAQLGAAAVMLMTYPWEVSMKVLTADACYYPLMSASSVLVGQFVLYLSFKYMITTLLELINTLSPHKEAVKLHMGYWHFIIAFTIYVTCSFFAMVTILLVDDIVWSGVTYVKKKGRIAQMRRVDGSGTSYTRSWIDSVRDSLTSPQSLQFYKDRTIVYPDSLGTDGITDEVNETVSSVDVAAMSETTPSAAPVAAAEHRATKLSMSSGLLHRSTGATPA
eukprot:GFYU01007882.1.p1 GENE.GFYU01007882.1~~GFYU01007882.1.p1  ORF type:complete len:566 (-),score=125.21 GFYU01007882.1:163-1860(-)